MALSGKGAVLRALDDPALAGITILAMTANALDEDRKEALEYVWMGSLH